MDAEQFCFSKRELVLKQKQTKVIPTHLIHYV